MADPKANLISADALKNLGLIQDNARDSIIDVVITRVQDVVVQSILGTQLFRRLKQGVIDNDLNANETELLDDYVAPLMVAYCDRKALKALTFELRAESAGKAKDEHLEPLQTSDLKFMWEDINQDAEHYRQMLIGYLKDNCDLFPEYNTETNYEDIKSDKGQTRTRVRFT